ncbi:hypothetical protein AV654_18375 [Paenibacillus elgii]|uniref:Copper amine oxidase-like N-terminal domain-containing protein n=1 Tax=Paenibacillus elgii TaxID=189691 RepID=A0A163YH47_9BACL|nr:stalk domain-containing protein [Paenibacillus elgii]KZE79427.1 hypothetical protein AV654_18375 [Paenibacillus elgii]
MGRQVGEFMKKYVVGFIAGILVASVSTSYAAFEEKTEAIISKLMRVKINGYTAELEEPPLIVNGNSYLPLRATADLLGYHVNYSDEEKTAYLDNKNLEYYGDKQVYYSLDEINEQKKGNLVVFMRNQVSEIFYNGEKYPFDPIFDYYFDNISQKKYFSEQALSRLTPKIHLENLKKYRVNRAENFISRY